LILTSRDALLIIDVQNDLVTGSLAVPHAEKIFPTVEYWVKRFELDQLEIILTRDVHPEDHCSFIEYGGEWVTHCVEGTEGAELHPVIAKLDEDCSYPFWEFEKGQESDVDEYSSFRDADEGEYELNNLLVEMNIERLFVCGLATEYCVLNTVIDALDRGYEVYLIADGIAGVNLDENDEYIAIGKMVQHGAKVI